MVDDPNANNGLITKIWGPPLWTSLHAITFGYPIKPTQKQKDEYKQYFIDTKNVLPCKYCRDSYEGFLTNKGEEDTWLTDKDLESRETLTKWFVRVHNRVNKKLDVDYRMTYEDVASRYEAYRAKCVHGTDDVADNIISEEQPKGCLIPIHENPYKLAYIKDCPIIPYDIFEKCLPYMRSRYIDIPDCVAHIKSEIDLDRQMETKRSNNWNIRNQLCSALIKTIREENIQPLEMNGDHEGLLSEYELRLVSMFSTTIELTKLRDMANKIQLTYNKQKLYRLKK
jgi:hypothetical protein